MTRPVHACPPRIFGLTPSPLTAEAVAAHLLAHPRDAASGPGLVVTPNIQHIALLRHDPALREAYQQAEIVICDGFPVYYYARLRGCAVPGRVTGCDVVAALFAAPERLAHSRLFCVVDHPDTAAVLAAWAERHGLADRIASAIPPFGFERDGEYCRSLAKAIHDHGTTLLLMGVGAPRSEVFVAHHRHQLPPCWALCIGQAIKIALGLIPRPPQLVQRLNLEWLWRLGLEPGRMSRRYVGSTIGFLAAILADLRRLR
ncbi:WecB/TagA/CpsF family glycosyltransferase [Magnetospirillum molischianum]|uniref:Putative N-acetylglucosaminyldiphosphoundecaprenol N-acetyl-beta-D-mannosaminyltransferase n=1 Tax=Magnetospirillum molischianum DSM 120 TaxID=1150626 RepID=H8FWE3_MAGML|nr:WecB/TagA/CpsF family glycosyltransferase [Magnetospirillum molischianum]CCG42681.1 putative N-acetylglucosaminyldiphosphoundecaprenol N-acetyl-beta-D-mannosaminyltransferase [Magnetospirillum molischianum DSM 120]